MRQKGNRPSVSEGEGVAQTLTPERKRERTMERAARLLAARPRSVGELRQRLLEKDWTDAGTVDGVLERLREYGYLDDEKFARNYTEYQVRQKNVGRMRLKRELVQHKVTQETADAALDEIFSEFPEEALLDEALTRRVRSKGVPTTPNEVQNLAAYLFRRGFAGDLVWEKVRALRDTERDED